MNLTRYGSTDRQRFRVDRLWRCRLAPDRVHVMRRSTGLTRALCSLTILLQLLLPVVSIADARLEREALSARAYAHVEATTSKDCVRTHKADCALCQHLTTPAAKAVKPAPPLSIARCELPVVATAAARVGDLAQRPSLPRAPPA